MPDPVLILHGDVLTVLATLPDRSVHCIVTSPPYWGLRAYAGVEPAVWRGAGILPAREEAGGTPAPPPCPHDWADALPRPGSEYRDGLGANSTFAGRPDKAEIRKGLKTRGDYALDASGKQATNRGSIENPINAGGGSFCRLCGAWRGLLGSEPVHDCLAWARGEPPCSSCFVCHMRTVAKALWRVLRDDGTMFLNIGDSYAGGNHRGGQTFTGMQATNRGNHFMAGQTCIEPESIGLKPTELALVPQRLMLALQADGWYVRSDIQNVEPIIVWHKKSAMPESTDKRPTRNHEYILMLTKRPSAEHFWDATAVREPHDDKAGPPSRFGNVGCCGGQTGGTSKPGEVDPNARVSFAMKPGARYYNPAGRNIRTVWTLKPAPCDWAYCKGCDTLFLGSDRKGIRIVGGGSAPRVQAAGEESRGTEAPPTEKRLCPVCGRHDAWVAHYAAFPPDLPRRCILAGTSEKGVCPKCGKPWERVVEKAKSGDYHPGSRNQTEYGLRQNGGGPKNDWPAPVSLGFRPACSCDAGEPVPATVLDPFCGSGTTLIVAAQLGRRAIGIDASAEYIRVARERVRVLATRETKPVPATGMPLFSAVCPLPSAI